jgi:hypothetical protein
MRLGGDGCSYKLSLGYMQLGYMQNVINGMHAEFNSQQYATKGTIEL